MKTKSATIEYEDYSNMIYKKGHFIANNYGIEFNEVVCQCNYIFVKCLETYNNTKSSFSTYLYVALEMGMSKWVKSQIKHNHVTKKQLLNGSWEDVPAVARPSKPSIVKDLMDCLESEQRQILHVIINRPHLAELSGADSQFQIKNKVAKYMTDNKGWTRQKTLDCFGKIKDRLRDLDVLNY